MKEKILVLLFLAVTMSAWGQTKDMTVFGFKGKVESAEVDKMGNSFKFDKDGNIDGKFGEYDVNAGKWDWFEIQKRTKTGLTMVSENYGKVTITIAKNKVTKMVFDGLTNQKCVRTYSYSKDGTLASIQEVLTYYTEEGVEYGANVMGVDEYNRELERLQQEYMEKMMNGMTQQAAQKWLEKAQRRLQDKLNGVSVNGYARKKKTKHTKTEKITFSNYAFDDFGNWVSRSYSMDGETGQQTQAIKYESLFWSEFYWSKLENEGNLRKIETFALNPNCHETYKRLAVDYWNQQILAEVEKVDNNNIDSLLHISKSPIINAENKETALNIVRENLYTNRVQPLRDYTEVSKMSNFIYGGISIFNLEYKNRINTLSNKLRADSINYLINKANEEFDHKNYSASLKTSKGILVIDNDNKFASNLCQEASYLMIIEKENNKSITEKDYIDFLNEYTYSSHVQEINNNRALYASSLFDKNTTNEELERVNALSTDDSTHKIVNKRYRKWKFKINHGRFLHVGIGGEFAVGGANTIAGGELSLCFGYSAHVLNVTVGAKYNYLTSTSQMFKSPKEPGKGYFERQYLSIPLMLRANLKHGYKGATYFAAGAEINVATFSAKLRNVEDVKDNEFAYSTSVSPRIAFGGRILGIELELYGTYDARNPFNSDYIENYNLANGEAISTACDLNVYNKQVHPEKFFDKIHGGLAIRIWL